MWADSCAMTAQMVSGFGPHTSKVNDIALSLTQSIHETLESSLETEAQTRAEAWAADVQTLNQECSRKLTNLRSHLESELLAATHASDARTPILFFFLQRLRALAATQSQS